MALAGATNAGSVRQGQGLSGYALFAALLSAAGLPLYIHAPKFFVDEYGVSLASLGAVLFGLRLLDVVQDPLLGRLSAATRTRRAAAVAIGAAVLLAGMTGLFAVPPIGAPLVWFALMLTLVFSAFSFLTISFYAQGVAKGAGLPGDGHLRVARWRETGALLGVCAAAIAPAGLAFAMEAPFTGFACGFAALGVLAVVMMRGEWRADEVPRSLGFTIVVQDRQTRRLLLIALVNSAPVAVSSTLFLFFVESRLGAPALAGPLLLVFFLSAACAAPLWGLAAARYGTKPSLLVAMALAIVAFGFALGLDQGDTLAFAVVCLATGAALGADLTLLPAAFAARMARVAPGGAEGFALWSFVSKLSLAFAAVILLPLLERGGFTSGLDNTPAALSLLSVLYAAVPIGLKLVAMGLLAVTKLDEGARDD